MEKELRERTTPSLSYFEIQAYMGTTKHMGGLKTTQALVERCYITSDSHVLDVGCGVGATACYLVQQHGCRVIGVDLRPPMVAQAIERARREGLSDRIAFRVADAQVLPFDDGRFDVVLSESVLTFVDDKGKAVGEYARVVRHGGYVGLNEEVWLQPPTDDVIAHVQRTWEIEPNVLQPGVWESLLKRAGLQDVTIDTYRVDPRREASQFRRYRLRDMARMFWRVLSLYIRSAAFRAYMKKQRQLPRRTFDYLGYVLVTGKM